MKKSKRKARNFINYLYRNYDVPRIPIEVHWHYPSIYVEDKGVCFGLFSYGEGGAEKIDIACCKFGTSSVLATIAHEFVHYLQYVHGRDMKDTEQIERDAESYGKCLYGMWLLKRDCSFVKAWEPKEEA